MALNEFQMRYIVLLNRNQYVARINVQNVSKLTCKYVDEVGDTDIYSMTTLFSMFFNNPVCITSTVVDLACAIFFSVS